MGALIVTLTVVPAAMAEVNTMADITAMVRAEAGVGLEAAAEAVKVPARLGDTREVLAGLQGSLQTPEECAGKIILPQAGTHTYSPSMRLFAPFFLFGHAPTRSRNHTAPLAWHQLGPHPLFIGADGPGIVTLCL